MKKRILVILIFIFIALAQTTFAQRLTTLNTSFRAGISTNPSDWINNTVTGGLLCGGYFPNTTTLCNPMNNGSAYYTTTGTGCTTDVGPSHFRVVGCDTGQSSGLFSGGNSPQLPLGTACDFIFRTSTDSFTQMGFDDDTGYAGGDDTQLTAGTLGGGANGAKIFLHYGANAFSAADFRAAYDTHNNLTVVTNYSNNNGRYYINNTETGEAGSGGTHPALSNLSILSSPQNPGENGDFNVTWFACYNLSKGAPQQAAAAGDTTSPFVASQSLNNTAPRKNDVVQCGINATDETAIGSVYFEHNLSGKFTNISSILGLNQQSVNFTANFTNTKSRNNVVGCRFTINDTSSNTFQSNLTTFTIADTSTAFTLALNNTSPRLDYGVQFSAMINDTDNISTVLASWNCSSSGLWINISNMTLEPNTLGTNYTINQSIGRVRGNICGFQFYSNDSGSSVFSVSSLTTFTISNTLPNATSIFNATDLNVATNLTLNATLLRDADGDTINYIFRFGSTNPPTDGAIISNSSTATSFNTNFTNETVYFARVDVTDGFDTALGTLIFNVTYDASIPICSPSFISNGTFYRVSTNITFNCTDTNLFELNSSFARLTGAMLLSNSTINISTSSKTINVTVDVAFGDGLYNLSLWAGDSKNLNKKMSSSIKVGKGKKDNSKEKFNVFQFNDTETGLQINLTVLVNKTNLDHPKDNQNLEVNFSLENNDFFKLTIAYDTSENNQTTFVNFTSNQPILQVYDSLSTHLLFGTGQNRLSYDSSDAAANFSFVTKAEQNTAFVQFIPTFQISKGQRIVIDPRVDNLNVVTYSALVEVDTGIPQFFGLNLTRPGNNSFIDFVTLNLTANVSDKNNNSILYYINGVKNASVGYQSNVSTNITITFQDGNYTAIAEINDTAGNKLNGSYILGFVVDTTAPTFISAFNRTVGNNNTDILTTTNVNISIFGLDDLYLDRGNFSENASGSWVNHSITIIGNNTPYHYIISYANFTANQIVGWKFYIYDTAGNELDPIYTFKVNQNPNKPASSGGAGAGGDSSILSRHDLACEDINMTTAANGSCVPRSGIVQSLTEQTGKVIGTDFSKDIIQIGRDDAAINIPNVGKTIWPTNPLGGWMIFILLMYLMFATVHGAPKAIADYYSEKRDREYNDFRYRRRK